MTGEVSGAGISVIKRREVRTDMLPRNKVKVRLGSRTRSRVQRQDEGYVIHDWIT